MGVDLGTRVLMTPSTRSQRSLRNKEKGLDSRSEWKVVHFPFFSTNLFSFLLGILYFCGRREGGKGCLCRPPGPVDQIPILLPPSLALPWHAFPWNDLPWSFEW